MLPRGHTCHFHSHQLAKTNYTRGPAISSAGKFSPLKRRGSKYSWSIKEFSTSQLPQGAVYSSWREKMKKWLCLGCVRPRFAYWLCSMVTILSQTISKFLALGFLIRSIAVIIEPQRIIAKIGDDAYQAEQSIKVFNSFYLESLNEFSLFQFSITPTVTWFCPIILLFRLRS